MQFSTGTHRRGCGKRENANKRYTPYGLEVVADARTYLNETELAQYMGLVNLNRPLTDEELDNYETLMHKLRNRRKNVKRT